MRGLWGELPELSSNRWRIQEHRDSSLQAGRNSTRSGVELGVEQVVQGEPGQLPEEHRGWDRDKSAQDTSTIQDLRSTTNRADSRAIRDTSALRAKRRYRVHGNGRCRHASRVLV
jgi:hypothetical protein